MKDFLDKGRKLLLNSKYCTRAVKNSQAANSLYLPATILETENINNT